jgi:hypothetical protein
MEVTKCLKKQLPPSGDPSWIRCHWPGGNWPPVWQNPQWPPIADPIPWPLKHVPFPHGDPIPFPEKFWEKIRIEDLIALRLASLDTQQEMLRAQFDAQKGLLEKQRQILSKYK